MGCIPGKTSKSLDDDDDEDDDETAELKKDLEFKDSDVTDIVDDDEDDDDAKAKKRAEAKSRRDAKLLANDDENDKLLASIGEKAEDDDDDVDIPRPPKEKNIFRRIQNRAIDRHIKFKRGLSNFKQNSVYAKNAAKASAKIPLDVKKFVDKQVDDWDEWDDNRRKEYIIKPGIRKKYFRALKLCLLHYGAFAINPVLNIVLLILQSFSRTKDVRIRNEFTRELNAEIDICQQKIDDAASKGDNSKKYKLMRIKARLEAERDRIMTNSKVI